MSTRSITIMSNGKAEIAVLYRHCDGYPTGQGKDLKTVLAGRKCVNGMINGPGDMACQIVAGLKALHGGPHDPGNFYLHPPGTRDIWEEYRYTVTYKGPGEAIHLHLTGHDEKVLYDGPIEKFNPEAAEETDREDEE